MRTRTTMIVFLCLLLAGRASAQWAVIDPSNIAQSIVNTSKNVVHTSTTAQNMVKNFQETVKIYEQGKKYYDALKSVNNLVRDTRKVQQTILMVGDITDIYVTNFQRMMRDDNFTVEELGAIAFGYTKLLEESNDVLTELKNVVNITTLSMTDKERMDVVERCHSKMRRYRNLVSYYTNKNISVSYLPTNDIHVPRDPHERFVGKSGHGLRGDALLSFDWGVGEVMKTLERLGIDENTIVVLSSDNGPVIDDGYKDQAVELLGDHKPAGDLRGGKYSNYEAGTRVPCILRWKNHVKPGVNDLLMSQLDWFASFAAMTGVTLPDGAAPDSENLLDAWLGKSEKGKEYFVTQNIQNFLGITDGEWKFIPRNNAPALNVQTNTELGNSPKDQLFKLNGDRSESVNVIDKNPEVAAKLKKELERIVDNRYLQNMN